MNDFFESVTVTKIPTYLNFGGCFVIFKNHSIEADKVVFKLITLRDNSSFRENKLRDLSKLPPAFNFISVYEL